MIGTGYARAAAGCIAALILAMTGAPALAQAPEGPAAAETLERITVHGASLEGNLEGDSPDRTVFVYLPPSYEAEPDRRYPVVYFLHGYFATAEAYVNLLGGAAPIDGAIADGVGEMIVVLPDAMTVYGGSMYSASPTIGDWEAFIAEDLVAHIDANYRTLASRESRGLMGHSMGGYGTLRIGMKYPEVFDSLYAMSSCCLSARRASPFDANLEAVDTLEAAGALGFGEKSTFAAAAAWSPNPENAPLYLNLPTENGEPRPDVLADFAANAPNAMLSQYVPEMQSFDAIALDVGTQDGLIGDNATMDELMTRLGIAHSYETYDGDHGNRIAERFVTHALPFFSEHLAFE